MNLVGASAKEKTKRPPKVKTKRSRKKLEELEPGDSLLTSTETTEERVEESADSQSIPPFSDGVVHQSFKDAVNAHWRKNPEANVLRIVLNCDKGSDATSFGSIFVKSSFLKKSGGNAIL